VQEFQGFWFAPALPAPEFEAVLNGKPQVAGADCKDRAYQPGVTPSR
jgi:hypothetical protein